MSSYELQNYGNTLSIKLDNGVTTDSNGSKWYLINEEGWSSGPPVRGSLTPRTAEHGEITSPRFYGSRTVTLTGVCKASSSTGYWRSRDKLKNLCTNLLNQYGLLAVTTELDTRHGWFRLAADPRLDPPVGTSSFGFSVTIVATDPRIYSNTQVVVVHNEPGANVNLTNNGNVETFLVVTVDAQGPVQVRNLTKSGKPRVRTLSDLPVGAVLNFADRTILSSSGGNLYNTIDLISEWWTLDPGVSSVNLSGTDMTVRYRHAYV